MDNSASPVKSPVGGVIARFFGRGTRTWKWTTLATAGWLCISALVAYNAQSLGCHYLGGGDLVAEAEGICTFLGFDVTGIGGMAAGLSNAPILGPVALVLFPPLMGFSLLLFVWPVVEAVVLVRWLMGRRSRSI